MKRKRQKFKETQNSDPKRKLYFYLLCFAFKMQSENKRKENLPIDKMQTMAKAKNLTMNGEANKKKHFECMRPVQIYVLTTANVIVNYVNFIMLRVSRVLLVFLLHVLVINLPSQTGLKLYSTGALPVIKKLFESKR